MPELYIAAPTSSLWDQGDHHVLTADDSPRWCPLCHTPIEDLVFNKSSLPEDANPMNLERLIPYLPTADGWLYPCRCSFVEVRKALADGATFGD